MLITLTRKTHTARRQESLEKENTDLITLTKTTTYSCDTDSITTNWNTLTYK